MFLPVRRSSTSAGLLELGEMRRDAALADGQDFLQFGHRKLLALQQQQDANPVRIGQQPKRFED